MDAYAIARVCHEANRALQIEQADPAIPISGTWDWIDQETKRSAIDGVEFALKGATPKESHENWCRFKRENGWTLGPFKDEVKKEHPLLVPYEQLPESQKVKDALFISIVRALR